MTVNGSRQRQDSTRRQESGSTWTCSRVAKEQHALQVLEHADPAFARAIVARLLPTPEERESHVIRRVAP